MHAAQVRTRWAQLFNLGHGRARGPVTRVRAFAEAWDNEIGAIVS